jgi:RimJ/RimL family protein N-acetyltransferase
LEDSRGRSVEATIRLRGLSHGDEAFVHGVLTDPTILAYLSDVWPRAMDSTSLWIDQVISDPSARTYIIETGSAVAVGVCQLRSIHEAAQRADVSVWIPDAHWSKEYFLLAMLRLFGVAFRELGLRRLGAQCYETDRRRLAAYEAAGFWSEGLLRSAGFIDGAHVGIVLLAVFREGHVDL